MEQEITVVAYITARAGAEETVEAALKRVESDVQGEPGCRLYALHRNTEQPGQFIMIERWACAAALEQHSKAEPFLRFSKAIEGLAELSVTTMTREGL